MKFIIEHLSKQFGPKEVLRDIDFTFEAGRIYGLLGRNGAGKTTLFNCLNRDIKADGGSFWLEEHGPAPGGGPGGSGLCALHSHGAGISDGPGVSEIFY